MCDMTQTKRKILATGDLHLRESLSIGLSFTMRLHRPLHIVKTFSRPKISSICKHFPACKDISTRKAQREMFQVYFPAKIQHTKNLYSSEDISNYTIIIVLCYKYLFIFLCSIKMIKDTHFFFYHSLKY